MEEGFIRLQSVCSFFLSNHASEKSNEKLDNTGSTLAAGTAERIVRLYDARAGPQSTGQLVGHEDRVRSMLFSDDGKYVSFIFIYLSLLSLHLKSAPG